MEDIIFTQIPINIFENIISEQVQKAFQNFNNPVQIIKTDEPEYITRKETAKLLVITLPTLHIWTKQGIVKGYRISTRIRYKRTEILEALMQVKSMKYRRK